MSNLNYGEMKANSPVTDDPVPFSETQPYQESEPLKLPARPPSPSGYGAPPPSYQSYGPPDAQFSQGPDFQSQQTIFIIPEQPTKEPDNLIFSIFTMLCCFFPLGIAALVFSIKTQVANNNGNVLSAQKNSRLSVIMARAALGFGIVFWILYIIILTV
nr:PREDICTED: synapse differentiation-inducing gene protein 1-like [Anolis carolinensis]|eukprot:XP_008115494.1 PREDICTED: synapse differentiation-inducing gene protein 1-like [Anolis carolinensis]